jgi:hypothetical protein
MFFLHSGFRYLFLLAAVATIAYAIYGLVTSRPYDRRIRVLSVLTMLSLDFTSFLGVAVIFSTRTRYAGLGPHIATMLFAMVTVHVVSSVMRKRPPEERSYGPHLVSAVVALALVWVGIAALGRPLIG